MSPKNSIATPSAAPDTSRGHLRTWTGQILRRCRFCFAVRHWVPKKNRRSDSLEPAAAQIEDFCGVAIPPGHRKRLLAAAQRVCLGDGKRTFGSSGGFPSSPSDGASPRETSAAAGGDAASRRAEAGVAAAAAGDAAQFHGLGPPESAAGQGARSRALEEAQRLNLPGSLGSSGEMAHAAGADREDTAPQGSPLQPRPEQNQRQQQQQPGSRASANAHGLRQKENSPSAPGQAHAARAERRGRGRGGFPEVIVLAAKLPPLSPERDQERGAGVPPSSTPLTPQQGPQQLPRRWVSPGEHRGSPEQQAAAAQFARATAQLRAIQEVHHGVQQRREQTVSPP